MDNNEIRRKILDILYNNKLNNLEKGFYNTKLQEKFSNIDENIFNFNLNYLKKKRLIWSTTVLGQRYYIVRITTDGIDVVEDNEKLNKFFPIINQTIVSNSPGTVINSNNVSINIQESFNQIYQEINERNPQNKSEIKSKVDELKQELEKDEINKSKVQECSQWLKGNAKWTISLIIPIILTIFGL